MRRKKYITMITVVGAVVVVLFVLLALDLKPNSVQDISEENEHGFSVVNRTADPIVATQEETILKEKDDADITALMKRYFKAVSECDVDTLNSIVATTSGIDEEELQQEGEFIEDYQNISCYVMDGLMENTYIVYVYFQIKFVNVSTLAPGLSCMYVCEDENGMVYINQEELNGEVKTYIEQMGQTSAVKSLIVQVNQELAKARRTDEKLDALVQVLNGEVQLSSQSQTEKNKDMESDNTEEIEQSTISESTEIVEESTTLENGGKTKGDKESEGIEASEKETRANE